MPTTVNEIWRKGAFLLEKTPIIYAYPGGGPAHINRERPVSTKSQSQPRVFLGFDDVVRKEEYR